jgi:hypothetical protein
MTWYKNDIPYNEKCRIGYLAIYPSGMWAIGNTIVTPANGWCPLRGNRFSYVMARMDWRWRSHRPEPWLQIGCWEPNAP